MTDNTAVVLAGVAPQTWLAQVDAGVAATFKGYLARHRFTEAVELMLAHLVKTETVRTRVHGPGPELQLVTAEAYAAYFDHFREVAARAFAHLQPVGGVNVTRSAHAAVDPGTKDTPEAAGSVRPVQSAPTLALVSCAPDTTLRCNHTAGRWRCDAEPHPDAPDDHYFVATLTAVK